MILLRSTDMPHAQWLTLGSSSRGAESGGGIPLSPRTRRDVLTARSERPPSDYWIRARGRAMACDFEITLADDDAAAVPAARAALDDVDRVEEELSVFRQTSAISEVNRRAAHEAVPVSDQFFGLLQLSAELHHATAGAFDITSTPLSRCWGFLQREGRLPSVDAIAAARAVVGFDRVQLDPAARTVRFDRDGVELNLGAIGKGYALDRIASGLRDSGVHDALLSAGRSSVLAVGGRGSGWHVEIVSPRARRPLAQIWLCDAAIGTSGAGEQYIECDGVRYGHVIDPRTGWPAQGILSVTVVASSAAAADALSTAFLVGGLELADAYCSTHRDVIAIVTLDPGVREVGASGDRLGASGDRNEPNLNVRPPDAPSLRTPDSPTPPTPEAPTPRTPEAPPPRPPDSPIVLGTHRRAVVRPC